jgi:glycyl-tRNA synthetase beta chain
MGRYYIKASGRSDAVAAAAKEHYAPLGPSDAVPTAPVSVAVALAEKIDKLTGFWAIDEKPTGSKDPFALRRAALGVIRIVLENNLKFDLTKVLFSGHSLHFFEQQSKEREERLFDASQLIELAKKYQIDEGFGAFGLAASIELEGSEFWKGFGDVVLDSEGRQKDLLSFLHDRLKVYLRDQGIRHDIIDACIAMPGNDDLALLVKRATALSEVMKTDDGVNLIQGFKRANNILTQAEEADGVEYSFGPDVKFAEGAEERALFDALDQAEAQIKPAMAAQDFAVAMSAMSTLRGPIDAFFDAVQVNAENSTLRRNRLNLLHRIKTICTSVADLSKIDG